MQMRLKFQKKVNPVDTNGSAQVLLKKLPELEQAGTSLFTNRIFINTLIDRSNIAKKPAIFVIGPKNYGEIQSDQGGPGSDLADIKRYLPQAHGGIELQNFNENVRTLEIESERNTKTLP
ncbi:MAG: hypothetical protein AB1468_03145 [Candidatus Micrarchaeota archaeon]